MHAVYDFACHDNVGPQCNTSLLHDDFLSPYSNLYDDWSES